MLKSGTWQCIATFIINMVRSMKAPKICYKREEIKSIKALTEISGMIYSQKKHFKTALTNILILWLNFKLYLFGLILLDTVENRWMNLKIDSMKYRERQKIKLCLRNLQKSH